MVVASLVLRLLPAALMQAAVVAYAWPTLIGMLSSGITYLLLGWWASLLGLVTLGMVVWIPLGGMLIGTLALFAFRLPAATPLSDGKEAAAIGLGWLLVMTGYFATAAVMWRLQPPVPTVYTDYGTAFLVGSSLIAMSVSYLAAVVGVRVLARRRAWPGRKTGSASLVQK